MQIGLLTIIRANPRQTRGSGNEQPIHATSSEKLPKMAMPCFKSSNYSLYYKRDNKTSLSRYKHKHLTPAYNSYLPLSPYLFLPIFKRFNQTELLLCLQIRQRHTMSYQHVHDQWTKWTFILKYTSLSSPGQYNTSSIFNTQIRINYHCEGFLNSQHSKVGSSLSFYSILVIPALIQYLIQPNRIVQCTLLLYVNFRESLLGRDHIFLINCISSSYYTSSIAHQFRWKKDGK